jgi:hypothetical protein
LLAGSQFGLLLLHAAVPLLLHGATLPVGAELAGGILLFALVILHLQSRWRRKRPDVTLDFWRLGMAGLIGCVLARFVARLWPASADGDAYTLLLGVLFIGSFAVSVVNGMRYKIVPFLAWFHQKAQLQAQLQA